MSMSTYAGIKPRSINIDTVAVVRGVRVKRGAGGLCTVQDISARGEYVTITDGEASSPCEAAAMEQGGKVPALASEACAVGDPAYSAAAGKFSKTSTSAVYCGKWTQAASGDGVLGEVELGTVA